MRPTTSSRPSSCSCRVDDALESAGERIAALIRKAGSRPDRHDRRARLSGGPRHQPHQDAPHAAHDWSAEPVNLMIHSPTGGGKTYLACAIGIAACQNSTTSPTPAWTSWPASSSSPAARDRPSAAAQRVSDTDLLIIDDFLTVGIDPDAASDLFAIPPTVSTAGLRHRFPVRTRLLGHALPDRVAADSIVNRLATTPAPSTSATSTCAGSVHTSPPGRHLLG